MNLVSCTPNFVIAAVEGQHTKVALIRDEISFVVKTGLVTSFCGLIQNKLRLLCQIRAPHLVELCMETQVTEAVVLFSLFNHHHSQQVPCNRATAELMIVKMQ